MRYLRFPLPMVLVALALPGRAQVSSSIRRLSREFKGEVPLVWTIEGSGRLIKATLRIFDDRGKECLGPRELGVAHRGGQAWTAWIMAIPQEWYGALDPGRFTTEWSLEWEVNGKIRKERTENSLRVESKGDGWLQLAFSAGDSGPISWTVPGQWTSVGQLPISMKATTSVKRVRYQIVDGNSEQVLRPWGDLRLDKKGRATLVADPAWPRGTNYLWLLVEDGHGSAWTWAQELNPRNSSAVGQPAKPQVGGKKGSNQVLTISAKGGALQASVAPSSDPVDWLSELDEPAAPGWKETNRVATVNVGYLDEERNGANRWPTDAGRPMSLSITGADGLGKPIYGVSYLLADRASSTTALDVIADSAAAMVNDRFWPGAKELVVGKIKAPVVFGPGKVDDLLGKPLAAGYSFAAVSNGVIVDAATWTEALPTVPLVGLSAIREGKAFRSMLLQEASNAAGYTGSEPISFDDESKPRDPFGITLAAQDPSGRTILSKGIGAPRRDDLLRVITQTPTTYISGFQTGLPPWLRTNGRTVLDSLAANPNLILEPANRVNVIYPGSSRFKNLDDASDSSVIPPMSMEEDSWAGEATISLGRVMPGTSIQASFTASSQALLKVEWVLDGGVDVIDAGTTSPLAPPVLTTPAQVTLRFTNKRLPLAIGDIPLESDRLRIDDLDVSVTPPPVGLEPALNVLNQSVVPGFSRTQYGTVDVPGQGVCTVVMVTDPDGSAVAEVKDPEGRTIRKIVNPDGTYTSLFKDYKGSAFWPGDPAGRWLGSRTPATSDQKNLVTQYVFDSNGHLRVVIPPLGYTGLWGVSLSDGQINGVLSMASSGVMNPTPYATYNAYDDSGHLVSTFNPDEGLTRFWVDQKGRAHFSQTEGQRSRGAYTRTLYDAIYRVLAVGETADNATPIPELEGLPVFDPSSAEFAAAAEALKENSRSKKFYDIYGDDPSADSRLDTNIRPLLPNSDLWKPFADGHLTRTEDANSIERYFYDQDGRIVIRWVSLKDGSSERNFAIGIYYDFAGRVKRLVYPTGPGGEPLQVVYTYDDLGRLFAVGTPLDKAYFARYAYHATGEVKAIIYGPGEGFAAKRMLQDPQGWLRSLTIQGR